MTVGPTGVVWIARPAEVNSTRLVAGAGAASLAAASVAWGVVSAAQAEAAAIVSKVVVDLAPAWIGGAAATASSRLVAFGAHVQGGSAAAAEVAARAGGQLTAYSTALLTMPTVVEIAAAKAATVAAVAAGPAAPGAVAAAEANERALDARAAMVMTAYEAASAHLVVQTTFGTPPPVSADSASSTASVAAVNGEVRQVRFADGSGGADGSGDASGADYPGAAGGRAGGEAAIPAPTVAALAEGAGGVAGAAVRIGSAVLGGVIGAISDVGSAAGRAASAAGGTAGSAAGPGTLSGAMGAGVAALGAAGAGGLGGRSEYRAGAASLVARTGAVGVAVAGGAGGAVPSTVAVPGSTAAVTGTEVTRAPGDAAVASVAASGGQGRTGSGAPLGVLPSRGADDEDAEHRPVRRAGYLEQLAVAGSVAPAVIGVDPDADRV